VKFVWWAETEAQAKAEPLGLRPLPKQLRPWIEARLKTISAGGKAGLDDGSSVTLQTDCRSPPFGGMRRRGVFSRPAVTVS